MSKKARLDKRQKTALERLKGALAESNNVSDEKRQAELDEICDNCFDELRVVALEKRKLEFSEDRCVCCGTRIPEGRQVCPICESNVDDLDSYSVFYPELNIR